MARLIPDDIAEEIREIDPQNGTNFRLQELYGLLRCECIQVVHLADDKIMILDEMGKLTGALVNDRATFEASASEAVAENDFVCGTVLICKDDQFV